MKAAPTREPPFPPIEPPETTVRFPDPRRARRGVVAIGSDFRAGTVLRAYREGIFPWPHTEEDAEPLVLWFSPDPRAHFPLEDAPRWSRSLRRTLRVHPYEVTVNQAFERVMRACGDVREEGTWILPELREGYAELHARGFAHSVEVWERPNGADGDNRELVGGIYGVAVGSAFAGESMFHTRTDASKIAFACLVERLRAAGFTLFDVQVQNPHLESLGCLEWPRATFLARLAAALANGPRKLV